jgi:signal transduction histidine kinase
MTQRQFMSGGNITLTLSPTNQEHWQVVNNDDEISHALFYAVREAVANAKKANPPAVIGIECHIDDERYRLVIRDDGPGFDTSILESKERRHRGLALLRARLRRIGGQAEIQSQIGEGTCITLSGPIRRNGNQIAELGEKKGSDHAAVATTSRSDCQVLCRRTTTVTMRHFGRVR